MTFLSVPFFLLFLAVMVCMAVMKDKKRQHAVLLTGSYIFYAYWDIRFLFLMLFLTFVSYHLAWRMEKLKESDITERKCLLAVGTAVSLCVLGFFKYWNFFVESFCNMFHLQKAGTLSIILPVGISFYTFQALSYLIDVYRKQVRARKSFWQVSLYIAFFPQLVAGPIVRSSDFLPQLDEARQFSWENVGEGIQIFLFGAIKKAVIADRMAVCVDSVFGAYEAYSAGSLALATVAYAIQIYCDFSGYSDMAIGVAKMMGYRLCRNFNLPYLASNPADFWRRWHISLSSWFRDYVYIPLGGNRKGRIRTYLNLFLTMLLSGLWHGASWNFVFWGAFHGCGSAAHRLLSDLRKKKSPRVQESGTSVVGRSLCIIGNFIFVCIGWVFFRAETIHDAFLILKRIFSLSDGISYCFVFVPIYGVMILVCSLWAYIRHNREGYYPVLDLSKLSAKIIVCVIIWLILAFYYPGENAFIYFQF